MRGNPGPLWYFRSEKGVKADVAGAGGVATFGGRLATHGGNNVRQVLFNPKRKRGQKLWPFRPRSRFGLVFSAENRQAVALVFTTTHTGKVPWQTGKAGLAVPAHSA